MPFPIIWGIPKNTPQEKLVELRKRIVKTLVDAMDVSAYWVRPLFPIDMLSEPKEECEGCNTIYGSLDTGMFFGKKDVDNLAKTVTAALAQIIWDEFGGRYEVEVFITNLDPHWSTLLLSKG
ncbi:hypothetical protein A2V49_01485 [candidate division WWE3 bacterium RBG_19FT_COMBO_34_6]|uniref:4-oxalocrotonate tautomerase domain-containing protein n=1 Tax=candidate division WWE3 bacterium RBG_19FT_COMBO_34_6 TaxID=1802612 RepID=A0A1F4UJX4_UNCKA|nr:MAG: hypothetical protein A2V49_01485 [candidate division WWE3 bacterium RBG_19FT_COMBO_34_6]